MHNSKERIKSTRIHLCIRSNRNPSLCLLIRLRSTKQLPTVLNHSSPTLVNDLLVKTLLQTEARILKMDIAFPKKDEKEFLKKKKETKLFYKGKKYYETKDKKIKIYKSTGNDRKEFEKGTNIIYGLELSNKKDFIFHRNSGINQVLAKIAQIKKVTIGFSFRDFMKAKNKAAILGRMQQNYKLCKKYKVKTLIASFAHKPEEIQTKTTLQAFKRMLEKRKLF